MANIGDTTYRGTSVWLRLPGNTTTTRKFYRQTGNGTSASAPVWDTIVEGDIASALSNTTSAHNALSNIVSNIISAGGGGVSVTSNELSIAAAAVSAQAASAHNVLSNVVSNIISAGGGGNSVTSNELSNVLSAHNALSTAVSALSASHTSLVNRVSANSATGGAGSVTSTELSNVLSAHNALSNVVSGLGGGGASVTSNELSIAAAAVSAQAASALNVVSNTVSALVAGSPDIYVVKTLDETLSSTSTLQDDNSLFFSVTSASMYAFDMRLILQAPGASTDWKFAWTVPSGVSVLWGWAGEGGSQWFAGNPVGTPTALYTAADVADGGGAAAIHGRIGTGVIYTSATAGTMQLRWAPNAISAADSIVKAGSHIKYRKIT